MFNTGLLAATLPLVSLITYTHILAKQQCTLTNFIFKKVCVLKQHHLMI